MQEQRSPSTSRNDFGSSVGCQSLELTTITGARCELNTQDILFMTYPTDMQEQRYPNMTLQIHLRPGSQQGLPIFDDGLVNHPRCVPQSVAIVNPVEDITSKVPNITLVSADKWREQMELAGLIENSPSM